MARLLAFFVAVWILHGLLPHVPVVGHLFEVPLLGFWLTAALLAAGLSFLGRWALKRARFQRKFSELSATDTPYNRGKLGSLLVTMGRYAQALPYLDDAVADVPDRAEWHDHRGACLLGVGRPEEAVTALERALELEPGRAYGGARLRLAEAHLRAGDPEASVKAIETFESRYGPRPQSAFLRGRALWATGLREEARGAWQEVRGLASESVRYQRRESMRWLWRARAARLGFCR